MSITKKHIELFNEYGFVILKNLFNNNELNDFRESLVFLIQDALLKASKKYNEIISEDYIDKELDEGIIKLEQLDYSFISDIYDMIPNIPSFMRLTSKQELLECINIIFKRPANHPLFTFTNRCRIDPPRVTRRSTLWHQEIFYTIPKSEFIQTWGPLVRDITKENGGIEVCIGSHKEGIVKQTYDDSKNSPTPFVVDDQLVDKYEKTTIEIKLGDIMIFSPKLFHRSGTNTSNHVRYTNIGMFHNIDFPTFRPPQPSLIYKTMTPIEYYNEVFQKI